MNIMKIMEQAKSMQTKIKQMQKELEKQEFEGQSGGGLVSVVIKGSGQSKQVSIDPSLLKLEEKETLEELIVAAYNNAQTKLKEVSTDNLSDSLIPGMNF